MVNCHLVWHVRTIWCPISKDVNHKQPSPHCKLHFIRKLLAQHHCFLTCFNLTHFNRASPLVLGSWTVYSHRWSFVIEEQQATLGWGKLSSFVHCFLSIGYCCWNFDYCIMHWIIATFSIPNLLFYVWIMNCDWNFKTQVAPLDFVQDLGFGILVGIIATRFKSVIAIVIVKLLVILCYFAT